LETPAVRIGPRHPRLAKAGYRLTRRLSELSMARMGFHRIDSEFAAKKIASIRERLERGETVYIAGLTAPGVHNTGIALIEVTQKAGPRIIVNNEEERFSGNKHRRRSTPWSRRCVRSVGASAISRPSSPHGITRF
jgi:carbamoyltransferase